MMESIGMLREKLDLLLRRHSAMKKELATARGMLERREEETALLRTRLRQCEEQHLALAIGHSLPDADARASARGRLDAIIAEIDKLLSTLHE
jgi:hypothetical protein